MLTCEFMNITMYKCTSVLRADSSFQGHIPYLAIVRFVNDLVVTKNKYFNRLASDFNTILVQKSLEQGFNASVLLNILGSL